MSVWCLKKLDDFPHFHSVPGASDDAKDFLKEFMITYSYILTNLDKRATKENAM